MKRIVSLLLAAVLIFAPCVQSFATGELDMPQENGDGITVLTGDSEAADNPEAAGMQDGEEAGTPPADGENGGNKDTPPIVPDITQQPAVVAETEDRELNEGEEQDSTLLNKGQVDVHIMQALDFKSDITFTVLLTGADYSQEKKITLGGLHSDKLQEGVTFDGLNDGLYTLSISAPGFRTRTREIDVRGLAYKLTYSTAFLDGYTYEAGSVHPGVLRVGNVNDDQEIDETDRDLLIDVIEASDSANAGNEEAKYADLNQDGKVDLADLNFFVQGYFKEGESRDASAHIETNVPASVIIHKAGTDTDIASGSIESLSKGEGSGAYLYRYGI